MFLAFSGTDFTQQMLQHSGVNVCYFLSVVCVSCAGNDALCPNWQIKVHPSWFRCLQSKQTLTLPCSPVRCVYLVTTLTRSDDWIRVQTSATNRKVFPWCLHFTWSACSPNVLAFHFYLLSLVLETFYNMVQLWIVNFQHLLIKVNFYI